MKEISEYTLKECLEEIEMLHGGYGFRDPEKLAYRIHDLTRWIPVSERMPTENGYYRIWDISEEQAFFKDGEWIGERFIFSDSPYLKSKFREKLTPTHWQRITPPEGA